MNDVIFGLIKAFINDETPKTPPIIAPSFGPLIIASIITGICTSVAFINGSGI